MISRPRRSLRRVIEDLGSTVLDLVAAPVDVDADVTGVQIHDPLDEPTVPAGSLLLGVGVAGVEQICALLEVLSGRGAGLVVKAPVDPDPRIRATVDRTGVALLGLTRAASWAQVAALLRSVLAEGDLGDGGDGESGYGGPTDLFALANAVGSLLDAPVTIEDRSSRVLAFSGRQDEADAARVETVLGRQVPDRFTRVLAERGFFRELYRSRVPVYIELGGDVLPRSAIAVRAGDEILGSVWVVTPGPLSERQAAALTDVTKIVALHLLRHRAGADVQRRLRADLMSTMLEGGRDAAEAARRLGVVTEGFCVLAAEPRARPGTAADDARVEAERQRLADALALHLVAIHPCAAAALIGGVVYAVLPVHLEDADAEARAVQVAADFLARTGGRQAAVIGVGRQARSLSEVARSRADADRALRVLRDRPDLSGAASYAQLHFESLLLQLKDLVTAEAQPPTGAYQRLAAHDAVRGGDLLATLGAYLDAFGDVNGAAAAVHVHPNTFRYRLRRLCEVSGLDLADPDARLAVQLQLRLHGAGGR